MHANHVQARHADKNWSRYTCSDLTSLTPCEFSKLAENSPNAKPARPPIAPDIADLMKQLFIMSCCMTSIGLGSSRTLYSFFFFFVVGSAAGATLSAGRLTAGDVVDASAPEAVRSSSAEDMVQT